MRPVLVSGEYPFLAERLEQVGFTPVLTDADSRLPEPVRFHPDLQLCHLKETLFVLRKNPLRDKLLPSGYTIFETESEPTDRYPGDVLCNTFLLGDRLIGNMDALDPKLLAAAHKEGLRLLHVNQGYAACAAAVVTENAVITADPGIAEVLEREGVSVLRVRPGYIELPGYDTGFIGGCCGLLEPGLLAFSGSVKHHPDIEKITAFLKENNTQILELCDGPLLDVGGIKRLF